MKSENFNTKKFHTFTVLLVNCCNLGQSNLHRSVLDISSVEFGHISLGGISAAPGGKD